MDFLTTLIDVIKAGTIKNVYARDDFVLNPKTPYVVVWQDGTTGVDKNTSQNVFVSVHCKKGLLEDVDNYIDTEIIQILHNKLITYGGTYTDLTAIRIKATNNTSQIVYDNDDGSISRDRIFTIPVIGLL